MTRKFKYLFSLLALTLLICYNSVGQISRDTTACLIRFIESKTVSYKIPMTKYCFVKDAGIKIKRDWPGGWVMKWDVAKKHNSNLLFLEMNSTDVEGWLGNGDVSGSVQLVLELPGFTDTFNLKGLSYKTKGLSIINNYGGGDRKKEYLNGDIKLTKSSDKVFISSFINLLTEHPNTKQQFILSNNEIPSLTFAQYQELENKVDSIREAEKDLMVNALTEAISSRDSIWEIESQRIKDSLRLHPYKGKFRFWISDINKAGFSRTTYFLTNDSIIVKEGPYDFIYLAKNYSKDSVYFKKSLNPNEIDMLSKIEKRIELDSLKQSYTNFCIMDGLILSFSFESANFSKDVTVSNYYNETIAFVIDLINKMTPKKYQLWYDKKVLLKQQADCKR
jgi:hypothetical protein